MTHQEQQECEDFIMRRHGQMHALEESGLSFPSGPDLVKPGDLPAIEEDLPSIMPNLTGAPRHYNPEPLFKSNYRVLEDF